MCPGEVRPVRSLELLISVAATRSVEGCPAQFSRTDLSRSNAGDEIRSVSTTKLNCLHLSWAGQGAADEGIEHPLLGKVNEMRFDWFVLRLMAACVEESVVVSGWSRQ